MSFHFSIEGQGVKLFRSAIQNLHKINCDTVGLQIFQDRVLLKSVDDADAGMMVVELNQKFFTFYAVNNAMVTQTQTQSQQMQEIEAVLSIRDILIVLKNKKIVKLDIQRLETVPNKIQIQTIVVQDGSEQIRKFKLSLLDGVEIQNLEEDLNSYATCVLVQVSEIQRLLNYFRSDGEVCIILNQNNKAMPVGLMEYISPTEARINMKVERRMLITDTEQIFRFVWHNSECASEATFVVPHFKALLQICQDLQCDVKLFVGQPGEMFVAIPEAREPHQDVAFGACIYLGTLDFSLADAMKPLLNQQQQQQFIGNTMQTTEPQTPPNFIATPQEMLTNNNVAGIIPDTTEQQKSNAEMSNPANQTPEGGNQLGVNLFQMNWQGDSPMAVDDQGVPPTQQDN